MGLELAEQLGWQLPDAIFYPTGGGTGLIGMWKAFAEMEALGWIGPQRPRMYAVPGERLRADRARVRTGRRERCALGECAHARVRHPRAPARSATS
jgi:threonine synthase